MKKWVCLVCGWIYDEARGWPEDGIAPGTRWEDIPEDWVCPECGVGKEDFEMVEVKTPDAAAPAPAELVSVAPDAAAGVAVDPVVIIGSGLAAYNLAKEFRKLDATTPLMMISRDDGSHYYKPNLSAGLTQGKTPDDLVMGYHGQVAAELSLTLKPFTAVTAIDIAAKTVHMGPQSQRYSRLVLATGAGVIRPPVAGDGAAQMHSVNDLLDYRTYRDALAGKSKVVIIGAGLIGCEFANDLLNFGFRVDVVDAFDHCMPVLLPEVAARAVERALIDKGAAFHFGTKAAAVTRCGDGFTVNLEGGGTLEGDLVVSAVGLRAHTALAEQAGLAVGRGITVNRYLETSAKDVYALGDCADVEGHLLMYVEPLLQSARALAKTLAGDHTAVEYRVMPVTVKTPACPVVVAPPPQGVTGEWDIQARDNDVAALFRDAAGEVIGFALTGQAVAQKKQLERTLPLLMS